MGAESCNLKCMGSVPPLYPNGRCTLTDTTGKTLDTFAEGEPCKGVSKTLALVVTCDAPPTAQFKYVYDYGQEIAGVVRIKLPPGSPAGVNVTLKHAEVMAHAPLAPADGSVYMGNLFWSNPVDVYMTKGGNASEDYTPSFTYHGEWVATDIPMLTKPITRF